MNTLYIIISIISFIFLFLAVLICSGIIYICYKVNQVKKQYDKGLDVNLIAHRQYNDEECGWDR